MKRYFVNEVFFSLQGEGVRAGTTNVFVRFGKCNLACTVETVGFDCDTEFESGRQLAADELLEVIAEEAGADYHGWVILTGGEPALQIDAPLLEALHAHYEGVAIETNGSIALPPGLDWITVSPKMAEHALRQRVASEVKYVRAYGQGIPHPVVEATHYLISPACGPEGIDRRTMAWCIDLVKANPRWRLSCQQHRWWNVR